MSTDAEHADLDRAAGPFTRSDPWSSLRAHTPANVAIGRVGDSLPTRELLRFGLAHAQARDAVHVALDTARLGDELAAGGWASLCVQSAAATRDIYLRRPDLGRRLSEEGRALVERVAAEGPGPVDVSIVIADGLSAVAVQTHAVPMVRALAARWNERAATYSLAPIVVATQARVALGDAIAESLGARMVVVLIGERPGLSSPDSLGVYLTHAPRVGRTDAERNCISNVRLEGLGYPAAAAKVAWIVDQAFRLGLTGVRLKDESDRAMISAAGTGPAAAGV